MRGKGVGSRKGYHLYLLPVGQTVRNVSHLPADSIAKVEAIGMKCFNLQWSIVHNGIDGKVLQNLTSNYIDHVTSKKPKDTFSFETDHFQDL